MKKGLITIKINRFSTFSHHLNRNGNCLFGSNWGSGMGAYSEGGLILEWMLNQSITVYQFQICIFELYKLPF